MEKKESKEKKPDPLPDQRRAEEIIPNYEHLFNDAQEKPKKKRGVFSKLLKINAKSIAISTILYFFQALPIWVLPLATANIIDISGAAISAGGLSEAASIELGVNVAVLVFVIAINVPLTVLRNKVLSKSK